MTISAGWPLLYQLVGCDYISWPYRMVRIICWLAMNISAGWLYQLVGHDLIGWPWLYHLVGHDYITLLATTISGGWQRLYQLVGHDYISLFAMKISAAHEVWRNWPRSFRGGRSKGWTDGQTDGQTRGDHNSSSWWAKKGKVIFSENPATGSQDIVQTRKCQANANAVTSTPTGSAAKRPKKKNTNKTVHSPPSRWGDIIRIFCCSCDSVPNFRRHLSSAFFYFNKLSFGKTFICKVERLSNSVDPDEMAHWAIPSGSLFVLRFYGPVNPMGSCQAQSVYLTTSLLGRLSPLSG